MEGKLWRFMKCLTQVKENLEQAVKQIFVIIPKNSNESKGQKMELWGFQELTPYVID